MKKYFTLIILSLILIISCEKDDICLENTTPNLVLKFYDFENDTLVKSMLIDSIRAIDNVLIGDYTKKTLDSILIPLDLNEFKTVYQISSGGTSDTIYFSYGRNDVFVSRSCGYKTIFENLAIDSTTNNWIKSYNINNTIIDNDTTAHINIYH
ncbi:hypothetical protein BX611_2814 [Lutibacter oceani]|uniref:Uncharacterized protein n=1 Tax=Lutibacter oceani TaxID=1853311 RepID=A0A3D9RR05_9FLAO|nr:DUF6452 family protein [Lutibacter oceani]REE79914.1 hypothetical protein BX611_2814 [Lutibacter oceani]